MTADGSGLKQRLSTWLSQVTVIASDSLVERMRIEAPVGQPGGPEVGGSANRGELRRSLRSGPVTSTGDRFIGSFVAPVLQAATTDLGAAPHIIRATKPHGRLAYFSRSAGKVIVFGSPRHPAEVHHPGNVGSRWIEQGLTRWWSISVTDGMRLVRF